MADIILNHLNYPILTVTVFLPLTGALLILFMKNSAYVRWTALSVTIINLQKLFRIKVVHIANAINVIPLRRSC